MLFHRELHDSQHVCTNCDHHMQLLPRDRFEALFDGGIFVQIKVPEPLADPRAALHVLVAAVLDTPLLGRVEVLTSETLDTLLETLLDQRIVHPQRVPHLEREREASVSERESGLVRGSDDRRARFDAPASRR